MSDPKEKSLKQEWKDAGRNIGKSFVGLGKTVIRSAKVGVDAVTGDDGEEKKEGTGLKENWTQVGKSFGKAAGGFGKAILHTVKEGADRADAWASEEDKSQDEEKDTPLEGSFEDKSDPM